jgi:hypothetical protein
MSEEKKESLFDRLVTMDWQALWEVVETMEFTNIECDDAEGWLSVCASCDGDLHLSVYPNEKGSRIGSPSFRARTYDGGGRHERVRQALLLLAVAIKEDQEE